MPTDKLRLSWMHTVEKVPWLEMYEAVPGGVELVAAAVIRSGAGMEPPSDAKWDGQFWRYTPKRGVQRRLEFANSEFGGGYTACWAPGRCVELASLAAKGHPFELTSGTCKGSDIVVERQ